ncbi:MAG: NADH-quinone oxidoreductase subunit N [Planctomycetota bacterium]|nr:NADH-quinone oxidoreductase subunit N [Planctomycetota bacterium]
MDWSPLIPAVELTIGILAVIVLDLLARGRHPWLTTSVALLALAGAAVSACVQPTSGLDGGAETLLGVLQLDRFSVVFTVFCCVTGFVTILATVRGEAFPTPGGEFLVLVLSAVLGMNVLAMSVDLVALYLAFETVSIAGYVLVAMRRADPRGNEAGVKYVLFGGVSSAVMLYGLSLVVGFAGGTSLEALSRAIEAGHVTGQPLWTVACVMVFAGFAFKISAVPFHFWAPDVYAGAPASVAGFLAVASKAAGFVALIRVVGATRMGVVPEASDPLTTFLPDGGVLISLIAVAAILTMTVGNLAALRQRELKRLLAWSSIAHAGYLLLLLAVWSEGALAALLFYLVAYLFMNLAAFLIAGIVIRERGTGDIEALRGMGRRNVGLSLALAVLLFSLTGLPPFFGFAAKLQLFYAVFERGFVWLGVIGLLNGVVSLYYYARVLGVLWFQEAEDAPVLRLSRADALLCAVLVVPVLGLGLFWWGAWDWARDVARDLPLVMGVR